MKIWQQGDWTVVEHKLFGEIGQSGMPKTVGSVFELFSTETDYDQGMFFNAIDPAVAYGEKLAQEDLENE